MEWLNVLGGIAASAVGGLITTEVKAWSPRMATSLLRRALGQLPLEKQERFEEQWSADLAQIPGLLGKIWFAAGLNKAGLQIKRDVMVEPKKAEEKRVDLATAATEAIIELHHRPVRPRILVVDDEPAIANTLAIILEHSGFTAKAVYSGEQAVQMAVDFKPDTLITDVVMTGITGIEAGIQVRKLLPQCRIMLFGGQAATNALVKAAAGQGHTFEILDKPVHPSILMNRIRATKDERMT